MSDRAYVPALGFDWLTRFYDPLLALTLRERRSEPRARLVFYRATRPASP